MAPVLVVDDSVVNRKVVLMMLRQLGHPAEAVVNGLEAVKALEKGSYSLVLIDMYMPEMGGLEAAAEIRRREGGARRIPIIALTAGGMEQDRDQCLAAGMDDLLSKPVGPDELAAVLAEWLASRELTRETKSTVSR